MNIVDKAIEKYVTVIICALALMFGGMYVFTQMPMQKRPDMDFPRVTVVTTMAGANATIMDSDVADVLEDSLSGISGVMSLTTSSYPGRSVTIVEFDMEKNINDAASDVRFDKPEYDIKLNRGLTDIMNVDVRALSTELYSIFGGKKRRASSKHWLCPAMPCAAMAPSSLCARARWSRLRSSWLPLKARKAFSLAASTRAI